ncbi:MAG: VOC family protein [Dokdonia sp.]|jgi:predicted enzyme related to lactoylglutathione lyase
MKVTWFEIPVKDMDRAISFYEEIFEISIAQHQFGDTLMGWLPPSGEEGAATGTLILQESYIPSKEGVLLYFETSVITLVLERVSDRGGQVILEKRQISETHGYMGVFIDSEGNRIALHSVA